MSKGLRFVWICGRNVFWRFGWHFLFVSVLTPDYSTLSCRLPSISGSDGVQIKYRPECYSQIGKLRVDACAMSQRKEQLDSLAMTDDHVLHSDLFVISKEYLSYVLINSFVVSSIKKRKGLPRY